MLIVLNILQYLKVFLLLLSTDDVLNILCTLQHSSHLMASIKPSQSPLDILPTSIFKDALESTGSGLAFVINNSLQSGHVPE